MQFEYQNPTVAWNAGINSGSGGAGYPVHRIEHTVSADHDVTQGAGLGGLSMMKTVGGRSVHQ